MKIKQSFQKEWQWLDCKTVLRSDNGNHLRFRPLDSQFRIINEESQITSAELNLSIIMHKSFNYSQRVGWNWHKSWKLPEITMKAKVGKETVVDDHLRCRLICCLVEDPITMKEIPMDGQTEAVFCRQLMGFHFENIKFTLTSYKSDGKYFHLILELYKPDRITKTESTIKCVISPPLFVDSRKAARNTKRFDYLKVVSAVQTFNPLLLKKTQMIRQGKRINQEIDDSIYGLDNYYTAQNIRNKCRHPFYVAIKFKKIFNLYYNTHIIQKSNDYAKLLSNIQKLLIQQPQPDKYLNDHHQLLTLQLKMNLNEREMILFLQSAIQIKNHQCNVTQQNITGDHWVMLDTGLLEQCYIANYHRLPKLDEKEQNKIKEEFDISSDEGDMGICEWTDEKTTSQHERYYTSKIEIQSGKDKKVCIERR